jgi:signal peptidase I
MGKSKRKQLTQERGVQTDGQTIQDEPQGGRLASILSGTFFSIALIVSISLISFTIVFFYSRVEGPSMMTTLNANWRSENNVIYRLNEDAVLVNRFATPSRGDIIVVRFYRSDGRHTDSDGRRYSYYIKRLIAYGGETIFFERKPLPRPNSAGRTHYFEIQVNGVAIDESYLDVWWDGPNEDIRMGWGQNVTYYDIWLALIEGRSPFGQNTPHFVQRVEYPNGIQDGSGNTIFHRHEIFVPNDHIFYMGDNRGGSGSNDDMNLRSSDSASFGPQPARNIVGVVSENSIIRGNQSLPAFVWSRIVYYITFRWI